MNSRRRRFPFRRYLLDGAVAQLGERYNGIVEVVGSIPSGSTKFFKSLVRYGGAIVIALIAQQPDKCDLMAFSGSGA